MRGSIGSEQNGVKLIFKDIYKKYKTGLTFVFFGLLTTVVDYGFYFLFSAVVGREQMLDKITYLWVNALSSLLAILFAYVTNKLFVFHSKSWRLKVLLPEISGFFSTRLIALFVSEVGIWILVKLCGLNRFTVDAPLFSLFSYPVTGDLVAKFVMSFISTALNFLFGKYLIFRKKKYLRSPQGDTDKNTEKGEN